ncbi:MAG: hypothetical protein RLZZ299_32 [Pseudomonadota bacterium]|jgi:xanthine dehydrogenase accessory factor
METTWHALLRASEEGVSVVLCTVVGVDGSAPRHAGARMVAWPDGRIVGTIGGGRLEHVVLGLVPEVLRTGVPRRVDVHLTRDLGMCCGGAMEVYMEPIRPRERLVVYGAGHVARPSAAIAVDLGFDVTVVDARDDWNTEGRFPGMQRVEGDPRAHARALEVDPRTWILVATHDHALDQDLLEILLARPFAWLGLVGSRAKAAKFFLRLRAAGVDEGLFSRVSTPVGLDLGAETPAEIAVSIAAEWVRVRHGRAGAVPALSEHPLPARGGDGVARAPRR